ncbi:nicotinate-nucleotide adenylyltransferase [Candidatus Pantoea edessiphila]|uniref:Probable nicotinate-nucleotide adenylyltransferase n=1 Tax=Candidatus Pantoea edessiphila TaxID=2044610 RepID=A0A2P5SX76_9GAMM|nr:nicotinate-nucleotide adenylyltransferase [Candidatus Pantoea edessiphila]PPI86900.1 nicotinic acid mononucleotide adenylyltransferase [Candidatus Pantoea edessiphila]
MYSNLYAIFGGTFDPVHFGHLYSAKMLASEIGLKSVILMPNNIPPHRLKPEANAIQRLDMLRFAINKEPLFKIDNRELQYEEPSWTVSTMEKIRIELGNNTSIAFIMGYDSLLNLTNWYRWKDLISLCHLLVCNRSDITLNEKDNKIDSSLYKYITRDINKLYLKPSGCIWLANTPFFNVSSTKIKLLFSQNKMCNCNNLLPQAVIDYIIKHRLYMK